ncbi:hypothetical protein J5N97_020464 [Dioscorea zingiberensis]|uniref:Uncharacterized protein n=1 Tax=Dioscorea zingiberensis TaxID=325984 RepID=A0A9D5CI21_9LILI|nr:hypothetical protein J5N97_020464 [Dioscorea zingiberensis]
MGALLEKLEFEWEKSSAELTSSQKLTEDLRARVAQLLPDKAKVDGDLAATRDLLQLLGRCGPSPAIPGGLFPLSRTGFISQINEDLIRIMALITQQTQVSYPKYSPKTKAWAKGVKLKASVSFHLVGRVDHFMPLEHRFHLRSHSISWTKGKSFKIKSFKGNAQNSESDCRDSSTKFSKTTFQLSQTQNEREDFIAESPHTEKRTLSYTSGDREDSVGSSRAIQNLFRKWLIILQSQASNQIVDVDIQKGQVQAGISESQNITFKKRSGQMLKAAFMFFLGLDSAISLPLLIFIPWYLTVKIIYGAEVTKELAPLWVLGPIIVALYIKIVQGLCSLYVYCFKQAIRLMRNLPAYSLLVYNYISEGKLKAFLWAHFWKPIVDIKNLDYGDLARQKLKQIQEWAVEKYLDYVESIWPYYCRTIRFLKKANLI